VVQGFARIITVLFLLIGVLSPYAVAEQPVALSDEARANLSFSPMKLIGGSTLMMVSPKEWAPLAQELSGQLRQTHEQYYRLFGIIPALSATVRLMEAEEFYEKTGAPRWTNAMYFRGEITIPLVPNQTIDLENLFRSLKHEYTHAIINALSGGRCPGWLDEGLAQWSEGYVNPALTPALKIWLRSRPPIPLTLLQGGFTRLQNEMVPPAYAQSLFAARSVINTFGMHKVRDYFAALRTGQTKPDSFKTAFGVTETAFEGALQKSLTNWKGSREHLH
jgi:hypothetical protein